MPTGLLDSSAKQSCSPQGLEITATGARAYDVTPDGQRLIVATNGLEGTPTITMIETLQMLIETKR